MNRRKAKDSNGHPDGMFVGTIVQADDNGSIDSKAGEVRSLTIHIRMDEVLSSSPITTKDVTVPIECYPHNVEELALGYQVTDGVAESTWALDEDAETPFIEAP
jgi:hypothetical protein